MLILSFEFNGKFHLPPSPSRFLTNEIISFLIFKKSLIFFTFETIIKFVSKIIFCVEITKLPLDLRFHNFLFNTAIKIDRDSLFF